MIKFYVGMRLVSSTQLEYVITLVDGDLVRYQHKDSGVDVQHSATILTAEISSGRMAIVPGFGPDLGITKQAILSRRVDSLHDPLNPAPYAAHQGPGHEVNLSGHHQGNRFCVSCQVAVGVPDFDADQASASVPVIAVVKGSDTLKVRDRMILRAYRVTAESRFRPRMQLTRNFNATIKGFNDTFGARCRTWDQVAQCVDYLMSREG